MLEESEARLRILEQAQPGPVIWLPIELGLDQLLAQDIVGAVDSPPFDNSSMDGYAVKASEAASGNVLKVGDETQAAGLDQGFELASGGAIRIFTGAPIPAGADAVIMQEDVVRDGEKITIIEGVVEGENIRRRGGDVCAGQRLLDSGTIVTPARIGLLASQGISEIPVHSRPLVQIVTTGDELVEPGMPLSPGEIYNSNGPLLQTAVTRAGGVAATSHAVDQIEELRGKIGQALSTADILVIAGGVSVGERDFVREVLSDLGVVTDFWRVRVKPGKPFVFGRHEDGTMVFGLPGNPVSAFVTFSLFVEPVVQRLLGHRLDDVIESRKTAIAAEIMTNPGDRPHYLRGIVQDHEVRLSGTQQSHAIFGLSKSNCLVRLEPEATAKVGEEVEIWSI